jgi:hypothetical protein
MSDGLTPRVRRAIFRVTGQVPTGNETVVAGVACQLERELQDANRRVEELEAYARKLEDAGDLLAEWHLAVVTTREKAERDVARWNEAKEAKP